MKNKILNKYGILDNNGLALPRHSHESIDIDCDFKKTHNCLGKRTITIRAMFNNMDRNNGKNVCMPCSRHMKYSGRNNPNCSYKKLDDSFLNKIDTEFKAYLLGWIASDGNLSKNTIRLSINKKDIAILNIIKNEICSEIPLQYLDHNMVALVLNSQEMTQDVCRHLKLPGPCDKHAIVDFPELDSDALCWAFIRGFFDGDGSVGTFNAKRNYPRATITTSSIKMREKIKDVVGIPASEYGLNLEWSGVNALDFLARLYDNATYYLNRKRDLYLDWSCWLPTLPGQYGTSEDRFFKWSKTHLEAVPPSKKRASDSGYDVTLIRKVKKISSKVTLYGTGIKVQPPLGFYFDLAPRSSMSNSGYILANSIGVIDNSYRGEILVALLQIDSDAEELQLPAKICQLIPRPIVHLKIQEVTDFNDTTERNNGSFGSTGI